MKQGQGSIPVHKFLVLKKRKIELNLQENSVLITFPEKSSGASVRCVNN